LSLKIQNVDLNVFERILDESLTPGPFLSGGGGVSNVIQLIEIFI
jgi:hypothetical protein